MEYSDQTYERIEAYLAGGMTEADIKAFEEEMHSDADLRELVEMSREAREVLDEQGWRITEYSGDQQKANKYLSFFKDKANKAYLQELQGIIVKQKSEVMNVKSIIGIAGVAALLVIGVIFLRNNNAGPGEPVAGNDVNQEEAQSGDVLAAIYDEYFSLDDLPSFTVRGKMDSVMGLIETEFYAKHYPEVNDLISKHDEEFEDEQKSLVYIYQGIAYGERGMYNEAYDVLNDTELFENSLYAQMTDWYLAMALLKGDATSRAIEILKEIAADESHYKQVQAKEILKRL